MQMSSQAPRIRDDLADLVPYDPDMRPVEVMLSANENSFGLPQPVRQAVDERLARVQLNRYPDATCPDLRRELASMWGVEARNIVVANGGDELLFNIQLAYGGPGRTLVNCPPTFSAYALYAKLTRTTLVNVPRLTNFDVDEEALVAAASAQEVSMVVVTSPNNPTGNLVDVEFVDRLAASTEALVLVDEAYAEFADPSTSCVGLVARHENVAVLRTLSKAYSLAGARLGYLVGSQAVVDALLSVRLPYSVSSLDATAALTVVEMRDALAPVTAAIVEGRAVLYQALGELANKVNRAYGKTVMTVVPSHANFLLVRIDESGTSLPDAAQIHELLAEERSILVRDFSRTPMLEGCLRLTVGTPDENERLLEALADILGVA